MDSNPADNPVTYIGNLYYSLICSIDRRDEVCFKRLSSKTRVEKRSYHPPQVLNIYFDLPNQPRQRDFFGTLISQYKNTAAATLKTM